MRACVHAFACKSDIFADFQVRVRAFLKQIDFLCGAMFHDYACPPKKMAQKKNKKLGPTHRVAITLGHSHLTAIRAYLQRTPQSPPRGGDDSLAGLEPAIFGSEGRFLNH